MLDDDDLGAVEDHEQAADGEPEDSDYEEETTQTADDMVSASLASGALS